MSMGLKKLQKKWPKAKIKKEFKDNQKRYPDALKYAVLEAIEGNSQAEVSKVTGIKPGLISNWKCGRFKGAKKKVTKKKKAKTKTKKEVTYKEDENAYIKDLEKIRREYIDIHIEMQQINKRLEEIKLIQYLEEISERIIFDGQRDLGYAISVVGEMINLLKIYLKKPNKEAYEILMEKLK